MSLNRTEQALFDYWEKQPDERRHWQAKVTDLTRSPLAGRSEMARTLERELWEYLGERTPHVATLRTLQAHGAGRISLMNLAELILRLWGPLPKPRPPSGPV